MSNEDKSTTDLNLTEAIKVLNSKTRPTDDSLDILKYLLKATNNLKTGWDQDDEIKLKSEFMESKVNTIFSNLLKKENPVKYADVQFSWLNDNNPEIQTIDPATDMWWHPKNAPKILASQMETRHLFFALRMLFNRAVRPEFRIQVQGQSVIKTSVKNEDTKHAIRVLFYQIGKRDNLTAEQLEKLSYMAKIVRQHL